MTISVVDEHFSLNKILLLTVGLWPYHRSKLIKFHLFLFLSILISFIIFQFTTFLTAECTLDLVIKIFSFTLCCTMFLIKYNSFCINAHTVRYLLEKLQHICNELKDDSEIAIFRKYGNNAKRYTTMMTMYTMFNLVIFILLPTWPQILGIFLLINASEPHFMTQIMTEYFIDREKYFYLILIHMDAAICIGGIALIATGTSLVGCLKHVCGMFRIASYRIEQAMMIKVCKNAHLTNRIIMHKKIVRAVDIHRKAMELCDVFKSNFAGSFFLLIVVGVICLSLNLYRLFQTVLLGNSIVESIVHFVCAIIVLAYIFLANYAGQEIADHYNYIFTITYSLEWYVVPLHIQRMILFILQRGTKPFHLVLGGIFVVSMESAAMLMSASISYFTVLFSTWQNP